MWSDLYAWLFERFGWFQNNSDVMFAHALHQPRGLCALAREKKEPEQVWLFVTGK